MKKSTILTIAAVLLAFSFGLWREFFRGTFDPVERPFVTWLAANVGGRDTRVLLTLVLYDTEASELAGASRMAPLDGALFARAASRLGAAAAGIEGLSGNPARMLEAAGGMPLFGGVAPENPPSEGWTPWEGSVAPGWKELPGFAGNAAVRFSRGFFTPPGGSSGPRSLAFFARSAGHPIPSFLALAWAAGQRLPMETGRVEPGKAFGAERTLSLGSGGEIWFFSEGSAPTMGMNALLVAAEKHEREGGESPLRGQILVLCRATADITRIKDAGEKAFTPAELWAQAWPALQRGAVFVLPGVWYPLVLAAVACGLGFGFGSRGRTTILMTGAAALFTYLLAALGAFSTFGLLLPLTPSVATLWGGLLLGRFFARRREPISL